MVELKQTMETISLSCIRPNAVPFIGFLFCLWLNISRKGSSPNHKAQPFLTIHCHTQQSEFSFDLDHTSSDANFCLNVSDHQRDKIIFLQSYTNVCGAWKCWLPDQFTIVHSHVTTFYLLLSYQTDQLIIQRLGWSCLSHLEQVQLPTLLLFSASQLMCSLT